MKKKDLKITKAGLHNIFEHRQKIELNQSSNIEDIKKKIKKFKKTVNHQYQIASFGIKSISTIFIYLIALVISYFINAFKICNFIYILVSQMRNSYYLGNKYSNKQNQP